MAPEMVLPARRLVSHTTVAAAGPVEGTEDLGGKTQYYCFIFFPSDHLEVMGLDYDSFLNVEF